MTPAWMVCAWPALLWQASRAPQLRLRHLGTHIITPGDGESPPSGQTLWANANDTSAAGVAWDWVEMQEGVVAMADPMALVTNLQLVDDEGERLDQYQAALRLNAMVHCLPWQNEVKRALHGAHADA